MGKSTTASEFSLDGVTMLPRVDIIMAADGALIIASSAPPRVPTPEGSAATPRVLLVWP